jgi:peptidyl-prolyl cis-trans isomerase A (cyclophilin A)
MKYRWQRWWKVLAAIAAVLSASLFSARASQAGTIVRFTTVMGNFDIKLFDATMPRTVTNFLTYVNTNKYNGTVVHRNSDTNDGSGLRDFVIQGGGYSFIDPVPPQTTMTYSNVATNAPILDEPGGGVTGPSNVRGTIAMAKSGPNTVTSQWFINQGNNSFLDSPLRSDGGFSAFGTVLGNGMAVVDAIGDLPLPPDFGFSISSPFNDLPLRNFTGNTIQQVRVANTVTITNVRVLNLAAGDYNRDGTVNNADFAVWKADVGSTTKRDADGNDDGIVNAADFVIWRNTLGQTTTPGSGSLVGGGVPEPSSALLVLFGGLLTAACARRRSRAFSA